MLAFPHILRYIALKISGLCIADRIFDFCRHSACLMYLQITKRFVILNAKRERIRIPLKRETDCHSRLRGFAMTREMENGLPQPLTRLRNDRQAKVYRVPYVFANYQTVCHSEREA